MSIELKGVHKAFGASKVLQGFTLDVQEGEIVTVIGPSGSGKSTTLKTIIGLLEPDEGEVWVDGENVHQLGLDALYALRRKVGYVFQFAALFDSMTVRENVAMGLRRMPGLSEAEIQERVEDALSRVDLEGSGARFPAQLSGGMKKRAGLARAIALNPRYLLYDEPTTGLDPLTVTMVDRLILRMRDELQVTSLVITHDIESAYRISDRIAMLFEGQVLEVGTPEEIRSSESSRVRAFVEGKPELLEDHQ
ncbi:MAG: ABC transporter ATP-binding protein [Gemmatimonadales bacterium]|nr:MAG: ABC transporter ATP-binding protein [Gemmatimonadales bacterium]